MPDVSITAPVAADPIDRLALGSCDPRMSSELVGATGLGMCGCCVGCMAEE